ncbi:MAG: zinc dependent phospholipase C family protein [Candidatus Avispirillum sp.]
MATWITHLRIAEAVMRRFPVLLEAEFALGNIAPDSGEAQTDGLSYMPPKSASHFLKDGRADFRLFLQKYGDRLRCGGGSERSFYLGYMSHLISDALWSEQVYAPLKIKYKAAVEKDYAAFVWNVKRDWYDLDHLFLKKNPDFLLYEVYSAENGIENTYMDEFSRGAFEKKRAEIVDFYAGEHYNLERDYEYMTEAQMDAFVNAAAERVAREFMSLMCSE